MRECLDPAQSVPPRPAQAEERYALWIALAAAAAKSGCLAGQDGYHPYLERQNYRAARSIPA
jgi:hypothetical protein